MLTTSTLTDCNPVNPPQKSIAFAPITEVHEQILQHFTPAVERLYRWILRLGRAGQPQELDLKEFCQQWNYHFRTAQRSLLQLAEHTDLVEIVCKFNSRFYKVIPWHPNKDQKIPKVDQKIPKVDQKIPKTGLKPAFSRYQEDTDILKETETRSENAVSVENDQRSGLVDPAGAEILKTVADEIGNEHLNAQLRRIILSKSANIVLNAVNALREQKSKQTIRNSGGWLRRALEVGFTPNKEKKKNKGDTPVFDGEAEEFNLWFNDAVRVGVVRAFDRRADTFYVLNAKGDWVQWHDLAGAFSNRRLQQMLAEMPDTDLTS